MQEKLWDNRKMDLPPSHKCYLSSIFVGNIKVASIIELYLHVIKTGSNTPIFD